MFDISKQMIIYLNFWSISYYLPLIDMKIYEYLDNFI